MGWFRNIIPLVASVLLAACGSNDDFTVKGEVEGLGEQAVEMIYFGNGGVQRVEAMARDGKVEFKGVSEDPTLVEISAGNRHLVDFIASNGDKVTFKMTLDEPFGVEIKGNSASRDYAKWLNDNDSVLMKRDVRGINMAVADYVGRNRESMASTLMLLLRFYSPGNELAADSLMNLIAPEARPEALVKNIVSAVGEQVSTAARGKLKTMNLYTACDSVVHFYPARHSYTLLVFSGDGVKDDSVTSRLKSMEADFSPKYLKVIEVSLAGDSTQWRASIEPDSATWVQSWAPGSAAAGSIRSLAIPRLPFFIVADSTARQIYRGTSVRAAERSARAARLPRK